MNFYYMKTPSNSLIEIKITPLLIKSWLTSFIGSKKFQAKIGINGKLKHLGLFNTAKEASEVYEAKAKELFGEYYSE